MVTPRDRLAVPVARRSAVERAVQAAALELLAREISIAEAVSLLADAMRSPRDETASPRERAAAVAQSHRASVIAEMERLGREGKRRAAPMILARLNAAGPRDPIEVANLANKFRRWRRKAEKRARARLPPSR